MHNPVKRGAPLGFALAAAALLLAGCGKKAEVDPAAAAANIAENAAVGLEQVAANIDDTASANGVVSEETGLVNAANAADNASGAK